MIRLQSLDNRVLSALQFNLGGKNGISTGKIKFIQGSHFLSRICSLYFSINRERSVYSHSSFLTSKVPVSVILKGDDLGGFSLFSSFHEARLLLFCLQRGCLLVHFVFPFHSQSRPYSLSSNWNTVPKSTHEITITTIQIAPCFPLNMHIRPLVWSHPNGIRKRYSSKDELGLCFSLSALLSLDTVMLPTDYLQFRWLICIFVQSTSRGKKRALVQNVDNNGLLIKMALCNLKDINLT